MRVLMVSHRFPPDAVAGVERYTESLARELIERGDDVAVVCRRPAAGPIRTVADPDAEGPEVVRLTGGGVDRDDILYRSGALDAAFERILADRNPDVVHVNHLVDLSPRFLTLARSHGAAVVMTLHDFWLPCPRITLRKPDGRLCGGPEGGRACARDCHDADGASAETGRVLLRALYQRRLLDVPDGLLCPSEYVADWFRGWGVERERIRAVPNGIRVPPRLVDPPEPRDDGTLRVAILGAVVPHKGHHVVLDALEGADVGPVTLFVHGPVGDPAYLRALRERAAGIEGLRLRVCGAYDPDDLELLLADVHVLVTPSIWPETFCLVIREALVRGVPVLTTRLGALSEAIEPGVNGFFYDHDKPGQLGDLLARFTREPELRRRLAQGAASTRVTTLDEHTALVREAYAEAIERRESNAGRAAAAHTELASLERLMDRGRAPGVALGEVA